MKVAVVVGLIVGAIVFGPLLGIWAINTLFGLGIAYTLKTWFASLVLFGAIAGSSARSSD